MRKIITFTAATLLMASAFAASDVYRWKGPDGTWHYSDQPRPGAELVRGGGSQASRPSTAESQPAVQAEGETETVPYEPLPVSDAVAQEVRAAAAAAKSEQCKKAEDVYQRALQARRIIKSTDAQGKNVYMTEAEADAARLQARASRDLACGA